MRFAKLVLVFVAGIVISFISEPVTTGFTAGAAVTIASTQLKGLFGLAGGKGSKFIQAWKQVFEYGDTITLADTVLGLTCLTALTVLWVKRNNFDEEF